MPLPCAAHTFPVTDRKMTYAIILRFACLYLAATRHVKAPFGVPALPFEVAGRHYAATAIANMCIAIRLNSAWLFLDKTTAVDLVSIVGLNTCLLGTHTPRTVSSAIILNSAR